MTSDLRAELQKWKYSRFVHAPCIRPLL